MSRQLFLFFLFFSLSGFLSPLVSSACFCLCQINKPQLTKVLDVADANDTGYVNCTPRLGMKSAFIGTMLTCSSLPALVAVG